MNSMALEKKTLSERADDLAWALRDKKWKLQDKWEKKSWLFKKTVTCLILLFLTGSIVMGGGIALAEGEGDDWINDLNGLKRVCASMFNNALKILMGTSGDLIAPFLKLDNNDFLVSSAMWETLGVVGIGMCIVYFLIDLNKTMIQLSSDFTAKSALAPMMKLAVGIIAISKGGLIISWILGFNNVIIDAAANWGETATADASLGTMKEFFENLGFFEALAGMIIFLLMWVVSLIVTLILIYNTFARKLEIILRVGLTPISMGDIYSGEGGNAVRYLKKLMALMMYGGCFIAIMQIGGGMVMSVLVSVLGTFGVTPTVGASIGSLEIGGILGVVIGTVGDGIGAILGLAAGILMVVCVSLAEIGALGMAKQACNDVFGV